MSKDFERVAFYVTKWAPCELAPATEAAKLMSTWGHDTIHGMFETQVALYANDVCE